MDSTMVPHLAYIVDQRYSADYATVYGVSQIAVCFAYGIAPLIGSQLAQLIGFQSLMIGLGTLNILHSLLIAWLESRSYLSNELGQSSRPSRCDPSSFRHLPNVRLLASSRPGRSRCTYLFTFRNTIKMKSFREYEFESIYSSVFFSNLFRKARRHPNSLQSIVDHPTITIRSNKLESIFLIFHKNI